MKFKKIFFIILIIFIFFISIPYLLSIKLSKPIVDNFLNKRHNFYSENYSFSWLGPQKFQNIKFSKNDINFEAKLLSLDLNFLKLLNINYKTFFSTKGKSYLKDGFCNIQKKIFIKNIQGSFDNISKIIKLSGNSKEGSILISINYTKNSYDGILNLKNFPTQVIDVLYPKYKNGFSKLFGSYIDLQTAFQKKGPIDVNITSQNILANLSLKYLNNNIFLNKDAYIQIKPQEEYLPLSISSINNPIYIKIYKENFEMPFPFDLKNLKIEKATIDLGKFKAKTKGDLGLIIGIMKYNYFLHVPEITVWCTPLDISIKNGLIKTSRMDMLLADKIHLCTWGDINLLNKNIKMTLGVTASALKESFGIKNINKDYVLTIPIYGKIDNIKIDAAKAAAKIAALKALQSKKNIFGKIINILKPLKNQSDIPKPKRPFPWERD